MRRQRRPPSRPTVMVVDDDADICELARIMLNLQDFTVLTAGDAATAITLCHSHDQPIDVLVTDLGLPGVSGGELARAAAAANRRMGIVYISGWSRAEALDRGLIEPTSLLLRKPFTGKSLSDAVAQTLAAA